MHEQVTEAQIRKELSDILLVEYMYWRDSGAGTPETDLIAVGAMGAASNCLARLLLPEHFDDPARREIPTTIPFLKIPRKPSILEQASLSRVLRQLRALILPDRSEGLAIPDPYESSFRAAIQKCVEIVEFQIRSRPIFTGDAAVEAVFAKLLGELHEVVDSVTDKEDPGGDYRRSLNAVIHRLSISPSGTTALLKHLRARVDERTGLTAQESRALLDLVEDPLFGKPYSEEASA